MSVYANLVDSYVGIKDSIHPMDRERAKTIQEFLGILENISLIEWKTLDELPKVPEGKYGVSVLMITYDPGYDEIKPGYGYDTIYGIYGLTEDGNGDKLEWYRDTDISSDFMTLYAGVGRSDYGPVCDEIIYWSYVPEMFNGKLVR